MRNTTTRTGVVDVNGLTVIAAVAAAAMAGMVLGVKLEESAWHRAGKRREKRKPVTASKLIAMGVLTVDGASTFAVLYLCYLAITQRYEGALPYLTTLIGALQAATAIVLSGYFMKSKAENTAGGITYDAAMKTPGDGDL